MRRRVTLRDLVPLAVLACLAAGAILVSAVRDQASADPVPAGPAAGRSVAVVRMIDGRGVGWWHDRAIWNRRVINRLQRVLLERPHVVEAVNLACVVYGGCGTLWRLARCETGGTFSARAFNRSSFASGLFQFLPSTWETTPFRVFSVWSPYANALAAGWMHATGRGSEWVC